GGVPTELRCGERVCDSRRRRECLRAQLRLADDDAPQWRSRVEHLDGRLSNPCSELRRAESHGLSEDVHGCAAAVAFLDVARLDRRVHLSAGNFPIRFPDRQLHSRIDPTVSESAGISRHGSRFLWTRRGPGAYLLRDEGYADTSHCSHHHYRLQHCAFGGGRRPIWPYWARDVTR